MMTLLLSSLTMAVVITQIFVSAASRDQTTAADPLVTPPPIMPRRVIAVQEPTNLIGYSDAGSGTFSPELCPQSFIWIASTAGSQTYGQCCTIGFESCEAPTTCSSGTLVWPDGYSTFFGNAFKFCVTLIVGEMYDPLSTSHPTPSVSVIWCAGAEKTSWTAWRTVANARYIGDYTNPSLFFDGSTVSGALTTNSTPSIGGASSGSEIRTSETKTVPSSTGPGAGNATKTGSQTSTTPSSSPSAGQTHLGLSTEALIGVVVSAVCSVLGLVFGIGFKIWKYRRAKKKEEVRQNAEGGNTGGTINLKS